MDMSDLKMAMAAMVRFMLAPYVVHGTSKRMVSILWPICLRVVLLEAYFNSDYNFLISILSPIYWDIIIASNLLLVSNDDSKDFYGFYIITYP